MKRTLTAEQQAARDERRAKFRKLAKQVADMEPEQRSQLAMKMPVVTVEGRTLSPFNCCLITSQNPTATVVGGFRQWIASGRAVRKGEHGLCLWVPTGKKAPEGEPDEVHFLIGTVFDVSQTDEIETERAAA